MHVPKHMQICKWKHCPMEEKAKTIWKKNNRLSKRMFLEVPIQCQTCHTLKSHNYAIISYTCLMVLLFKERNFKWRRLQTEGGNSSMKLPASNSQNIFCKAWNVTEVKVAWKHFDMVASFTNRRLELKKKHTFY